MSLLDILPPLPNLDGMVSQNESICPADRCDKVSSYHAGRRPVRSHCLSWVREGNTSLFDWQNGDFPPGDLRHVPLKYGRKEGVPQIIIYLLKCHHYYRGEALH